MNTVHHGYKDDNFYFYDCLNQGYFLSFKTKWLKLLVSKT